MITKEYPLHQFSWKVLGAIFKQTGRIKEAFIYMSKSVELNSQDSEAHNNLGVTLKELGKLKEAEASFIKALKLEPIYIEALNNLGLILKEQGKVKKAIDIFSKIIKLNPNFVEAYYNIGNSLKSLGKLKDAKKNFKKAIALKPDYPEAYNNLGNTLKEMNKHEDAIAIYKKAIRLKPNSQLFKNLGVTLQELGRLEEAEANYNHAINLQPEYVEAHRCLSIIKKYFSKDKQYLKMEELYLDKDILKQERCQINFALAKASEDLGDFKKAFNHYSEGNALRKILLNYQIDEDKKIFSKIKSTHPLIMQNSLENNYLVNNVTPIFIVGMPRSGTTLVEQIISSHPSVYGGGELFFIKQFGSSLACGLSTINKSSLLNFREKYLKKLQSLSKKHLFITDKMPQNFLYLGLISIAFPEAKIIHVKRDPAAVCWGNYKQYFTQESLGFRYSLNDLIIYYKLYENLMQFWEKSLNDKIFNFNYDILTMNQKRETKRLINHIDLDWNEKCMHPQDNTRSVATASNTQIRKKIYQGSSEKWKNYKPFIKDVFDNF